MAVGLRARDGLGGANAARARLQKGELSLDLYDMRKSLAEKGLKYIDGPLD